MYTIAICDDDKNYTEMINSYILEFADQLHIAVDTYKFDSGHDFINKIQKSSNHYDIIFLDIDMPVIDGLETAGSLRLGGIGSLLVFVTSMEDKVFEAFGFNALKFVLKRNLRDDLKDAFIKAIDTLNQSNQIFGFKTNEGIVRLTIDEILYFIYEGRKVNVVTRTGSYILNSYTLADIEALVYKKGFVLINRYVIVNVKYVNGIFKNILTMDNEDTFDISRPRLKEVYKVIADYLR